MNSLLLDAGAKSTRRHWKSKLDASTSIVRIKQSRLAINVTVNNELHAVPFQCPPTSSIPSLPKTSRWTRARTPRCFVSPAATRVHVSSIPTLVRCTLIKAVAFFWLARLVGITWRRDDGSPIITKANGRVQKSDTFEGELMNFVSVDRRHLGAYLCIAKNDVPPAVSKRVFLNVNCKTSA